MVHYLFGITVVPLVLSAQFQFASSVSTVADDGHAPIHLGACADSAPRWLRDVMTDLTSGTGRWIADNSAYRSANEPFDEYGLEWRWGLARQTVRGRLFGLQGGREVGDFWEFRLVWHLGECQALLYQFGTDGTIGVGPMTPDGTGGTELDQMFYHPEGRTERVKHESRVTGDEEHGSSFSWVDGEWQKRRSYVWRRDPG